jgi:peptidoglycan hydrolase-like protein with peptidoglycan-binding domain
MNVTYLAPAATGANVSALQALVRAAGGSISLDEIRSGVYGPSTANAVRALQQRFSQNVTGVADNAFLTALQGASFQAPLGTPAGTYLVEGSVLDGDSEPLAGAKVTLQQVTIAGPQPLAVAATTDANGFYRIAYEPPKLAPNVRFGVQVQVADATGKVLSTSDPTYAPGPETTIPVYLGGQAQPSEHSIVTKTIGQVLNGVALGKLVETTAQRQVTFVAGAANVRKETVAFASITSRLAAKTSLPEQFFYGLLQHRVPPDAGTLALAVANNTTDLDANADRILRTMYLASDTARATAIKRAVDANTIPTSYGVRSQQDLAQFTKLANAFILTIPLGTGKTAIGDILTSANVSRDVQQTFAPMLATAKSRPALWKTLSTKKVFPSVTIATLKFATTIGTYTRGHLPLITALVAMRTANKIQTARDLAKLTTADWEGLLNQKQANGQPIGVPANLANLNPATAVASYASMLETSFTRAFPTTAFCSRLAADATSTLRQAAAIGKFVDANPAFSLPRSNIDRYLTTNKDAIARLGVDVAAMRNDLLAAQRIVKVAPTYALAKPLLDKGIRSAHQIYHMGRDRFVTDFTPAMGVAQAARTFATARQTHARALMLYTQVNQKFTYGNPSVLQATPQTKAAIVAAQGIPTLAELFGSLDQCACEDCQSVLSAAAYLVDSLYFLSQRKIDNQSASVKDALLKRRPDIAQIQLNCANTNTELPYIDLVNELLEAAVTGGDTAAAAAQRQTTRTTPELNAYPEYLNQSAYDTLSKTTSVYPWVLPFNLPLTEARRYLTQLGTTRAALMKRFTPQPDYLAPQPGYQANGVSPLAVEMIGLSAAETDTSLSATATSSQLWLFWGLVQGAQTVVDPTDATVTYSESSWTDVLKHVRILLGRSGVTFDQLSHLLNTKYLNASGSIALAPSPATSCDLATMVVSAPSAAAYATLFDRMHRFVRLWRHLSWTIYELDAALRTLQPPNVADPLNALFLRQIAVVDWAAKRFGIPVANALAIFSVSVAGSISYQPGIDTYDVPALPGERSPHWSLYHNLFQNNLNPSDPAFAISKITTKTDKLENHTPALDAALALADADVSYAITQLPNDVLSLPNVGLLFSYATLAEGSKLAVKDVIRLASPVGGLLEVDQPGGGIAQLSPAPGTDGSAAVFDASKPELLVRFTELCDLIGMTPFSVAELDYLLRHNVDASSGFLPDDVTIGTFYLTLWNALQKLSQGFVPTPDPLGVQTQAQLTLLLGATAANAVMQVLNGTNNAPEPITTNLKPPIFDPGAASLLAGAAATLKPGAPRYQYVLAAILAYQARQAAIALCVQQVASQFSVEVATAKDLLTVWLPSRNATTPTKLMVDDLLALPTLALADTTDPIQRTGAGYAAFAPYNYFDSYVAMAKFARVVGGFGFTVDETRWIMNIGTKTPGWLDPTKLPLAKTGSNGRFIAWRRLAEAATIKRRMPSDGTPFTTIFDVALDGTKKLGEYVAALVSRTQWSKPLLTQLVGDPTANPPIAGLLGLNYPADFQTGRALTAIIASLSDLNRYGITGNIGHWLGATITADQASDIIGTVKSKYTTDQWPDVAKKLRDPLREAQRDALVGYVLSHPPAQNIRWADANDVYGYYLIDVEMGSCALTSRIVQANCSIQQFVQRCFLHVEPGITVKTAETSPPTSPPADAGWLQWQWRYAYRLWQANREVFLYPENWIDPTLRHDKSTFFTQLETDISQAPITTDTAEDAFRNYLDSLNAVARLDVVGLFHDTEVENDGSIDYVYVLARGQGSPPTYYYRKWVNQSSWTGWVDTKLDIASDHILPVVWNRRFFVFWAIVSQKSNATQNLPTAPELNSGGNASAAASHLEVQLAWSELKKGKWLPKQVSPQVLVFDGGLSTYDIALKSHLDGSNLVIDIFQPEDADLLICGRFILGGVGNAVDAYVINVPGWNPRQYGPEVRNVLSLPLPATGNQINFPTSSAWDADTVIHDDANALSEIRNLSTQRPRVSPCYAQYINSYGSMQTEVLLSQADSYRLIVPHQTLQMDSTLPFVFQDSRRTYFVVPSFYTRAGYFTGTSTQQFYHQAVTTASYTFYPFYHAFVPLFLHELNRGGVDQLFNPTLQANPVLLLDQPATAFDFTGYYQPTGLVTPPGPEGVDFDQNAGYAIYNWELFFHAPFEIADRLVTNMQFPDAKHWYEYVFNPTSGSSDSVPAKFWVTQPFKQIASGNLLQQQIAALMQQISYNDKNADSLVAQWQADPFDPDMIANLRPIAYMRAIVMRYIDNLIAWGDQLFKQDTLESINEATQCYVLAAQILGARPEITPAREVPTPQSYAQLEAVGLDAFANAVVAAENALAAVNADQPVNPSAPSLPLLPVSYFCVPPNSKLLAYWDTVADRLFKIRHCMNIEGVVQQLALFAPPIEPGLLVRAAAAGVDLRSLLTDMSAPPSPYRFETMLRHAIEVCEMVRSFGSQLLSVLEKSDAEALAVLRSTADKQLQAAIVNLRQRAVDQAQQELAVIDATRVSIQTRSNFYEARRSDLTNTLEAASLALQALGIVSDVLAIVLETTSGVAGALPSATFGAAGIGGSPTAVVNYGGDNVSSGAAGFARAAKVASAILHTSAAMTGALGGYVRRQDEWNLQADIAAADLNQNTAQRLAASVRADMATLELQNQQSVAQTASDVDDFLHSKFTNQELYDWMITQSSATYLQAYQLAYAIAKRAERCFQRELALPSSSYIQFGYWDSLRKGLLAGDQLLVDLQTMNADYKMANVRERELSTSFSLLANDPYALVMLRTKGSCFVTLPKAWFDLENPSLYMRRMRSLDVNVPCVVGPYVNVSMTVSLFHNETTVDTQGTVVSDTGGVEAIITSTGVSDRGYEMRGGDDRYFPFEGAGVENSVWQLQLNPVFQQFDYSTITDVILNLHYTARDGGVPLASTNATAVAKGISSLFTDTGAAKGPGVFRLISVRHEYPSAWAAFLNPGPNNDQILTLDIESDRFPFFTTGGQIQITGIDAIADVPDNTYSFTVIPAGSPQNAAGVTAAMTAQQPYRGVYWAEPKLTGSGPLGAWSFKLKSSGVNDFRSLTPNQISDLVLILQYRVSNLVPFRADLVTA